MTETTESAPTSGTAKKRGGGLSTMLLADLKQMAGGLGIAGAGGMKKAQLVEAIKAAQSGGGQPRQAKQTPPEQKQDAPAEQKQDQPAKQDQAEKQGKQDQGKPDQGKPDQGKQDKQDQPEKQGKQDQPEKQGKQDQSKQGQQDQGDGQQDGEGGRRNRRRRGRDRNRAGGQSGQGGQQQGGGQQGGGQGGGRNEPDTSIMEDDVLVPAAGILDVLDNYAFVRTSGYLAGPDDVYLSLSMVRKYGLRRGDALVGQVRQPREGERREKFNPMVRIDSVNGAEPDASRVRSEFDKLTPLHPADRLRLETESDQLLGRVVDLVAPVGKGQRGLIVSPAGAGKTTLLHAIARAVTRNNPECHLMVVLVDERPEEVTDFERSVKGEVVASTFDRAPADHATVAELAIERAKRLVELGHDVVVLMDGITRLARAYNLASTGSGRTLAGAVDPAALYPTKRFLGAARNIENGGSLTILATAAVDTGSETDETIFEELQGTGNSELRLSGELAERQLFPAVDVAGSGTRHDEHLLGDGERDLVSRLRRAVVTDAGPVESHERLLSRLRRSQTNVELLTQVQREG